jgi:hypothetical protein
MELSARHGGLPYNPNIQEAKAGESRSQGQCRLHGKMLSQKNNKNKEEITLKKKSVLAHKDTHRKVSKMQVGL